MKLLKVRIENLLSYRNTTFHFSDDGRLVLVGPNGAGKSNLIRVVDFIVSNFPNCVYLDDRNWWDPSLSCSVYVEAELEPEDYGILIDTLLASILARIDDSYFKRAEPANGGNAGAANAGAANAGAGNAGSGTHAKVTTAPSAAEELARLRVICASFAQWKEKLVASGIFKVIRIGYRSSFNNSEHSLEPFCSTAYDVSELISIGKAVAKPTITPAVNGQAMSRSLSFEATALNKSIALWNSTFPCFCVTPTWQKDSVSFQNEHSNLTYIHEAIATALRIPLAKPTGNGVVNDPQIKPSRNLSWGILHSISPLVANNVSKFLESVNGTFETAASSLLLLHQFLENQLPLRILLVKQDRGFDVSADTFSSTSKVKTINLKGTLNCLFERFMSRVPEQREQFEAVRIGVRSLLNLDMNIVLDEVDSAACPSSAAFWSIRRPLKSPIVSQSLDHDTPFRPNLLFRAVDGSDREFPVAAAPGGVLDVVVILTTLICLDGSTVFLDDPGIGLHPASRADLSCYLYALTSQAPPKTIPMLDPLQAVMLRRHKHTVIITHSPEMIGEDSLVYTYRCFMVKGESDAMRVSDLFEQSTDSDGVVTVTPPIPMNDNDASKLRDFLMQPFIKPLLFSEGVILVEGRYDYRIFSAIARVLDRVPDIMGRGLSVHRLRWEVIPLGSKNEAPKAVSAAYRLNIPWVFICDFDANKRTKRDPLTASNYHGSTVDKVIRITGQAADEAYVFEHGVSEKESCNRIRHVARDHGIFSWIDDLEDMVLESKPSTLMSFLTEQNSNLFSEESGPLLSPRASPRSIQFNESVPQKYSKGIDRLESILNEATRRFQELKCQDIMASPYVPPQAPVFTFPDASVVPARPRSRSRSSSPARSVDSIDGSHTHGKTMWVPKTDLQNLASPMTQPATARTPLPPTPTAIATTDTATAVTTPSPPPPPSAASAAAAALAVPAMNPFSSRALTTSAEGHANLESLYLALEETVSYVFSGIDHLHKELRLDKKEKTLFEMSQKWLHDNWGKVPWKVIELMVEQLLRDNKQFIDMIVFLWSWGAFDGNLFNFYKHKTDLIESVNQILQATNPKERQNRAQITSELCRRLEGWLLATERFASSGKHVNVDLTQVQELRRDLATYAPWVKTAIRGNL